MMVEKGMSRSMVSALSRFIGLCIRCGMKRIAKEENQMSEVHNSDYSRLLDVLRLFVQEGFGGTARRNDEAALYVAVPPSLSSDVQHIYRFLLYIPPAASQSSKYFPKHSSPLKTSTSSGITATATSADPSPTFGKITFVPSSPGYRNLTTFLPNTFPQSCS